MLRNFKLPSSVIFGINTFQISESK